MLTSTDTKTIKSLTLPTGVTLQYTEQGDPDGTPVIFLHGYPDSLVSFQPTIACLPPAIRAIAPTQRGHGDSSRPATGYAMSDFATDLVAFMDALDIPKAILAGHSMGSLIAPRTAIDYPERVMGMVLIGAFYQPLCSMPDLIELRELMETFSDPVDPEFAREFQLSTIHGPVDEGFFETLISESLKLPAFVLRAVFDGLLQEDLTGQIAQAAAPTLIIWGERDAMSPLGDQHALVAAMPEARLLTYPGTGHSVQWEQPDRVAGDIAAFVQSLTG